jgi:two-component system OmpR family response regulator
MLVLSRRLNEKLVIPSIETAIQVVSVRSGVVRLGITAPPEVLVLREELRDRKAQWNETAAPAPGNAWARLVGRRLDLACQGFDLLRRHMQAGLYGEAEETLERIDDELRMLRQRLGCGEGQAAINPPKSRKALLVEDNPNERELLATFLRRSGLDVDTAGDGSDALDYLRSHGLPDVMLLDMGLPRCDGATTVRAIRQNPACAGLRIFAVTGHLPDEYDLARGPAGIDRWFHKPFDPTALIRDLNSELDEVRR